MYYYKQSEPQLWTVGCDGANGKWNPESDHSSREDAANRVAYLNGGEMLDQAKGQLGDADQRISALTAAMISQAESMQRIASALEKLTSMIDLATSKGTNYNGDPALWFRVESAL